MLSSTPFTPAAPRRWTCRCVHPQPLRRSILLVLLPSLDQIFPCATKVGAEQSSVALDMLATGARGISYVQHGGTHIMQPKKMSVRKIHFHSGGSPWSEECVFPCKSDVAIPSQEFVKSIRKTCGNVHELTTLAAPCHESLENHARDFGCCWETVMKAYKQLDPQAHHSWRMWQGTVSGKAGIVFDGEGMTFQCHTNPEPSLEGMHHPLLC